MTNKDRQSMIHEISIISFYVDELRLFLDTHPNNTEALEMYNDYVMQRKCLVDEYVEAYGPLNSYNMEPGNTWRWVVYPWPWEGVC